MNQSESISGMGTLREVLSPEFGGRLKKDPRDFTSGLKLPKLDLTPPVSPGGVKGGSGDYNAKVRLFKNSRKTEILNNIIGNKATHADRADNDMKFTGLFKTNLLDHGPSSDLSDAESNEDRITPNLKSKVKNLIGGQRRMKNRIDHEVHSRISKAFEKIEIFEKGVRSFDDTLLLAKGRLVEAGKKSQGNSPSSSGRRQEYRSGGSGGGGTVGDANSILATALNLPKSMMGVPKSRALQPESGALSSSGTAALAQDSEALPKSWKELSKAQVHQPGSGKMSSKGPIALAQDPETVVNVKPAQATMNLSLNQKWSKSQLEAPPSDSNTANKPRFGPPRLQLHESKGSQELKGMRNKIQIMNRRSEQLRNKKSIRNKMESVYTGDGNLTRLMTFDPNQGPAKEFTDFLQAYGGVTGGWDKEDHDIFLTAYMKFKHKPAEVVRVVSKECPGRQLQEIAAHLEWYEKYVTLNSANKAYVRQWKINKRHEREQMFKMAKEEAKAKIEGDKSRIEMIKAKREVEREREKLVLNDWKKSKKPEIKKLQVENDLLRDPDGPARTIKLGQHLQITKEKLVKLLPPTHQVRQVLTKNRLSLGFQKAQVKEDEAVNVNSDPDIDLPPPLVSDDPEDSGSDHEPEQDPEPEGVQFSISPSSGIFSDALDMEDVKYDQEESPAKLQNPKIKGPRKVIIAKKNGNQVTVKGISGGQSLVTPEPIPEIEAFETKILQQTSREKMLAFYRTRDATIMAAKRNAIQLKESQKNNKAFLTTEETKERISKITLPSSVTRMTKGMEMRQNLRQLEAIEASARQELKKNSKDQHRYSRVPTPQMFKAGPMLNTIPKLGTPAWRTKNN